MSLAVLATDREVLETMEAGVPETYRIKDYRADGTRLIRAPYRSLHKTLRERGEGNSVYQGLRERISSKANWRNRAKELRDFEKKISYGRLGLEQLDDLEFWADSVIETGEDKSQYFASGNVASFVRADVMKLAREIKYKSGLARHQLKNPTMLSVLDRAYDGPERSGPKRVARRIGNVLDRGIVGFSLLGRDNRVDGALRSDPISGTWYDSSVGRKKRFKVARRIVGSGIVAAAAAFALSVPLWGTSNVEAPQVREYIGAQVQEVEEEIESSVARSPNPYLTELELSIVDGINSGEFTRQSPDLGWRIESFGR